MAPTARLGTPLSPSAVRVLLLGSGELGKEVVIELQRLGCEVIAADRYKAAVIGETEVKAAVEAGVRMGWDRFIGAGGVFVGMEGFGASAPAERLYEGFGITARAVADAVRQKLG